MGRSNSKNDWRRYKKFEQENEKLRKEVSKLRKVINNLVVDNLAEKQKQTDIKKSSDKPTCEVCGNNNLSKIPISRPDGDFEVKICNSCNHRSDMLKVKKKD
jgi:hypothetical protein